MRWFVKPLMGVVLGVSSLFQSRPALPCQISRRHVLMAVVPGVAWWTLRDRAEAAPSTKGVSLNTQRYEDLTASEMVSMTVGLKVMATDPHKGQRIIQLSLDLEHLISVLDKNPAKVSDGDVKEVRLLRDQLAVLSGVKVLLHLLGDFTTIDPDDPDNTKSQTSLPPTGHPTRFGR